MTESLMARNVSVLGDQGRVEVSPLMSLDGAPSPRGDRVYVGKHQRITVTIADADTPTSFAVALDHVPTQAMPASGLKVTSGPSVLAVVNEYHGAVDSGHEWTQTRVSFIGTCAGISQDFLIL